MKNKSKCILCDLITTLEIRNPIVSALVNLDSMFTFQATNIQRNIYIFILKY